VPGSLVCRRLVTTVETLPPPAAQAGRPPLLATGDAGELVGVGEGLGEHPRLGAVSRPKATRFMSARMSSPPARAPGTWVETRTGTPSSRKVVPGPVGVAAPEALEGGREELDLGEHRVRLRTVTFLAVMPTADMGASLGMESGSPWESNARGPAPAGSADAGGHGAAAFSVRRMLPGPAGRSATASSHVLYQHTRAQSLWDTCRLGLRAVHRGPECCRFKGHSKV
jgi:hypothetical protein